MAIWVDTPHEPMEGSGLRLGSSKPADLQFDKVRTVFKIEICKVETAEH